MGAIPDSADYTQHHQCPTFHVFLIENAIIVLERIGRLDGQVIFFVSISALVILQFIGYVSEEWTPLGWFYKLQPIDKFTFTLVVLAVVTALIFQGQLGAMQGQLREMQTDNTIRQFEIRADLQLSLQRSIEGRTLLVTPKWTNIGKSDAYNVSAWADMKHFTSLEELNKETFLDEPPQEGMTRRGNIIQGDALTLITKIITPQQADDFVDQKGATVIYGYVEYLDIFKTFFTVRFCREMSFERNSIGGITSNLPFVLPMPCESRTEKKATE